MQSVRHYTIKTMNGLVTFKCPVCKHSVTTGEFSVQNGSRRTQAARAMNEHATAAHGRPVPMSPGDAYMWHAR
jgi:ectoine hydroxylase-related dioxygenase (phytanoyl-CoA dioxygenase family)